MIIDPYRLIDPSYVPWANVVGLYHMGPLSGYGAGAMDDFSSYNYDVLGTNGDTTYTTAQVKFGTHSQLNPDTPFSCTLFSASQTEWLFTSTDFCIEMWVRPTALNYTENPLIGWRNSNANKAPWYITITDLGAIKAYSSFDGTSWGVSLTSANGVVAVNTWTHIAYQRRGNEFSIYADGSRVATTTASGSLMASPSGSPCMYIEGSSGNYYAPKYIGYVDELRLCKQAVYDGTTYTVPTSAFPNG